MFITFDGIEGSGKSTQVEKLCSVLDIYDIPYIMTREPGGTEIGEQLRELMLHGGKIHEDTELLLMFAARAEHIHKKIKPALAMGKWVVCDRFTDASVAYQGGGRGIDIDKIELLASMVHSDLVIDRTFICDIPAQLGIFRAHERGKPDRFESEHMDFFTRTREAYLSIAEHNTSRCKVLDATLSVESLHKLIVADLDLGVRGSSCDAQKL